MTDLKGKNDKFVILNVAQNAIVPHPISPNARLVTNEPLAEDTRVFAPVKVLQEPRNQHPPHPGIELRKLLVSLL